MSAVALFTIGFGLVAAVGTILTVFRPTWQTRRTARAEERAGIAHLLQGKSDRVDAAGNVIEKGYPAIQVSLANLSELVEKQLKRNGGSSMADALHRIEESLTEKHEQSQHDIADLRQVADQNALELKEVRKLAGEAAFEVARSQERHQQDHGRLVRLLDELRTRIWERFEEGEMRERAYLAALSELGFDIADIPNPLGKEVPDDEDDDS